MKKGNIYYSAWDWIISWIILVLVVVCVGATIWIDLLVGLTLAVFVIIVALLAFCSTYYEICGNELIVHSSFRVYTIPINEIKEIRPTKSWLAAPAASLTKRLEIIFKDRRILKKSNPFIILPLIISPSRQNEFIRQLQTVNPDIITALNKD